ncbi:MAG: lytic transglycosylase domain-containing protein [Alphaproteobacteria bacterium]|nr:lytic transglycosylase domain-containing protein [Alphaproteobacteria bacterium]
MTRARGAYWLGRAYEALGDKREAEQSYETAAALSMTYHGQLALTRLYAQPEIKALPEPPIPANVRLRFFARDVVQAAERLLKIGQADRARLFFKAATEAAEQRYEYALLMDLAYKLQRPDWAITAAKAANQKNIIVGSGAFPVLSIHIPTPPDPAFTHALIRQESLFNSSVGSPAGARGLMQLMPGTAKGVAKKLGMAYEPERLAESSYNLRLGTTYAQEQLDNFDGSFILALAGYNAGPRRVREWIEQNGDPRTSRIDPIDWIEMIPIYETRNYIQRILENYQVYRARLRGGQAPLTLLQDLKR